MANEEANEESRVVLDAPELLYRADDAIEAAMYVQALENAGIRSHLAGGQGSLSFGELGADALRVDVFVGEEDVEAGRQVIEAFQAARADGGDVAQGPWTCPSCGEECDANFGTCWKCEAARP